MMQHKEVITSRDKVNENMSKLSSLGKTKRTVWFSKRRYGNL